MTTTRNYHHIAVLKGGLSAEREVSLRSGAAVAQALRGEGYTVTEVDVGRDIATVLTALKPDACAAPTSPSSPAARML